MGVVWVESVITGMGAAMLKGPWENIADYIMLCDGN